MADKEQFKELIANIITEEMAFRPRLLHGFATANAEVAKETLLMLIDWKSEDEIEDWLFSFYGYKRQTAKLYVERAKIMFRSVALKYPEILNGRAKNVTPKKKALPNKAENQKGFPKRRKNLISTIHAKANSSIVE